MTDTTLGVSRRDYKDRRPGKPVAFHEPDPNRFAVSAALHAKLEREQKERLIRVIEGRNEVERARRERLKFSPEDRNRKLAARVAASVVRAPAKPELQCDPAAANVTATRDGKTLYFPSTVAGGSAFVPSAIKTVDALVAGVRYGKIIERTLAEGHGSGMVFGWRWERKTK